MALALGVIRLFGEMAPVHAAEWWIGDLALAGLVAAPAVLGLLGAFGREMLLLPAGVTSVALSLTFLSGAGLPLIVPAVLYLIAFARRVERRVSVVAVVLPIALEAAAFAVLLIGSYQTVCWREVRGADGRTALTRDRAAERLSSEGSFRSDRVGNDVVSAGCTNGAIDPK
ncbi:MAG: hypothetical protein ACRDKJ_14325, partial [Actinomycetota bacterium]